MKTDLGFKSHRWIFLLTISSILLVTMGFTAAPVAAITQAACGSTYTVQNGDTLGSIAALCGVTLSDLEQTNPQIANFNLISIGQQINVPSGAVIPVTGSTGTYTVVSGDTLSNIAVSAGVSLATLEAANPQITNPNLIFTGEVINLPTGASIPVTGGTPSPTPVPGSGTYTVVAGDTLSSIAANFGITLSALEVANPQITNSNLIFPGNVLTVP